MHHLTSRRSVEFDRKTEIIPLRYTVFTRKLVSARTGCSIVSLNKRKQRFRRVRFVQKGQAIERKKLNLSVELCCGERGIRTLGTRLRYTRFPGVPFQPLMHLSNFIIDILDPDSSQKHKDTQFSNDYFFCSMKSKYRTFSDNTSSILSWLKYKIYRIQQQNNQNFYTVISPRMFDSSNSRPSSGRS